MANQAQSLCFILGFVIGLLQFMGVSAQLISIPDETSVPTLGRPIFKKLVNKAVQGSSNTASASSSSSASIPNSISSYVISSSSDSTSSPSITTFPVYKNLDSVTFTLYRGSTVTASIDDDFMNVVLFNMMYYNDDFFGDSWLSSLDPANYPELTYSKELYASLGFPDKQFESELGAKYASLFTKIPTADQASVFSNISTSYLSKDRLRTLYSLYFAGLSLEDYTSTTSYDTSVPESTAANITSVYSDLYTLAQCVALDYDINYCFGHDYNQFSTAQANTNTGAFESFQTIYSSWSQILHVSESTSLDLCTSLAEFIDIFPWSNRILGAAKIAFQKTKETFIAPSVFDNVTFNPPLTMTTLSDLTQVTLTFDDNTSTITASVDDQFLKIALFRMMDYYTTIFNEALLKTLDPDNYSDMKLSKTSYKNLPFHDQALETALAQSWASLFSKIPKANITDLYLMPLVSNQYMQYDAVRTQDSWYFDRLGLYNFTTVTSLDTLLPESTASGDEKVFSDLYVLAQCVALDYDLVGYYGNNYNKFATSAANTNTTSFNEFRKIYTSWRGYLNSDTSISLELCTSMVQYIDMFPWKDRIHAEAKTVFKKQTDYLTTPLVVGGSTFAMPPAPSSTVFKTVQVTGNATASIIYPFEILYNNSDSSTVTRTTTVSKEIITTGPITNTICPVQTITSKNAEFILCGAQALILHFYGSSDSVTYSSQIDSYLSSNANNTGIAQYSNILTKYKKKDGFSNNDSVNEIMVAFYNLIFNLPEWNLEQILDIIGYCYLERQSPHGNSTFSLKNYKTGDGQLFASLFKFGYGSTYLDYDTKYVTDGSETGQTTVLYQTTLATTKDPLIIRSLMTGGGGDVADLADIAHGAIKII